MSEEYVEEVIPYPVADLRKGPTIEWKDFQLKLWFIDCDGFERDLIFQRVLHFSFRHESELCMGGGRY